MLAGEGKRDFPMQWAMKGYTAGMADVGDLWALERSCEMNTACRTMGGLLAVALLFSLGMAGGCAAKHPVLSSAAVDSLEAAFPAATIGAAEAEKEDGLDLFEAELPQDGKEIEVLVSPDGVIVEVETEVAMKDLPKAAADAIAKAAAGAKVEEIEREETRAVVRDGKLVKLAQPKITYEAEFLKDGKQVEVEVAADGTVLSTETEDDDEDDDED